MPVKDQSELPELVIRGPFGGIQSEIPPEAIETFGFLDCKNILFDKGEARVRPRSNELSSQPATLNPGTRIMDLIGLIQEQGWSPESLRVSTGLPEGWVGISDFFNVRGDRLQVAMTPTRLLQWVGGGWSGIGGIFGGRITDKFSSAVVAEKLCMCQGIDPVMIWDGITPGFAVASADAVPAKYMMELANHLMVCNTIETGAHAYQRVRWTGANDPTDWVSFNTGQIDLFNDLGPINGCVKLFRYGYIFQQKGIVQVIPTGIGTNAFVFQPLSSNAKGLTCPRSLAVNGETDCAYVGKDNVYMFDGTASNPIGDMPVQGGRAGARSRIFADIMHSVPEDIEGFVTTSINGNPFNAYWLVVPNVAVWVFNYDEQNWTRFTFDKRISVIGNFQVQGPIRIKDLLGSIQTQAWSPATLLNNNPFDSLFIGYADGTPGIFDFTGWCETDWYIITGQLSMSDKRHEKTIKKLRLIYRDYGESTIHIQIINDRGQIWAPTAPTAIAADVTATLIGNASGASRSELFQPSLAGMFFTVQISGASDQPFAFTELAPIYSVGGEQRSSI